MAPCDPPKNYEAELERYHRILSPVFFPQKGVPAEVLEFVCSLLRVGGMELAGWDPLHESRGLLQDLRSLTSLDLPMQVFQDPDKTRWRLMLLAYSHLTEMDAPYHLLANLIRVHAGEDYMLHPFWTAPKGKNKGKMHPAGPKLKIRKIKELATGTDLQDIGKSFDEFYLPEIRHAVDHSDYVLHGGEFRMRKGSVQLDPRKGPTRSIPLDLLREILTRATAFYEALFTLEREARAGFRGLSGKAIPYDFHLKGLLQFLVGDEGLLYGFKVHWPNGLESTYTRTQEGCKALNIYFDSGVVGLFVGFNPPPHDQFSPLVPLGGKPVYTSAEGSREPLVWPG